MGPDQRAGRTVTASGCLSGACPDRHICWGHSCFWQNFLSRLLQNHCSCHVHARASAPEGLALLKWLSMSGWQLLPSICTEADHQDTSTHTCWASAFWAPPKQSIAHATMALMAFLPSPSSISQQQQSLFLKLQETTWSENHMA